jgi:hypothetical protein
MDEKVGASLVRKFMADFLGFFAGRVVAEFAPAFLAHDPVAFAA